MATPFTQAALNEAKDTLLFARSDLADYQKEASSAKAAYNELYIQVREQKAEFERLTKEADRISELRGLARSKMDDMQKSLQRAEWRASSAKSDYERSQAKLAKAQTDYDQMLTLSRQQEN